MASDPRRGLAFAIDCRSGYVIGLKTHRHPLLGDLVWLAEGQTAQPPSIADVDRVTGWRWPTFLLVQSAIRQGAAIRIGTTTIPAPLEPFPLMRAGGGHQPWFLAYPPGVDDVPMTKTTDRRLPPQMQVNAPELRRMIDEDWTPEKEW